MVHEGLASLKCIRIYGFLLELLVRQSISGLTVM